MKHRRVTQVTALLCAASLLLALGACAPVETVKGWFSSDARPYASYNLDKLIKLGAYTGVEAEFVTEDGYLGLYMENAIFAQGGLPRGIADDPAKETVAAGDLVFFGYEGTAEGATAEDLEGMKGTALLIIGSGSFIEKYEDEASPDRNRPGFEEQMVGQPRNVEFDVTVRFPDVYQDANGNNIESLAGNEAVFKCTVHKIGTESEEVTDDGIAGLTGGQYATIAGFRPPLQENLEAQYQAPLSEMVRQANINAAYAAAYNDVEFLKLPAKEMKYWNRQLVKEAEQSGAGDADDFALQNGYESAQALCEEQVQHELFVFAVAAKENLGVTGEDLQALLSDIRARSGETGTDAEIYDMYGGKGRLLRMLTMDKVSQFIYENAKDAAQG